MAIKKAPLHLPKKKSVDISKLDEFAAGANGPVQTDLKEPVSQQKPKAETPTKESALEHKKTKVERTLPWQDVSLSEKVIKPFNLRTNEIEIAKLKYIKDNKPGVKSVHDYCIKAVLKEVEKDLKKLLNK